MARRLTKHEAGRRLARLAGYLEGRAEDARALGHRGSEQAYDDAHHMLMEVFDDLGIDVEAARRNECPGSDSGDHEVVEDSQGRRCLHCYWRARR